MASHKPTHDDQVRSGRWAQTHWFVRWLIVSAFFVAAMGGFAVITEDMTNLWVGVGVAVVLFPFAFRLRHKNVTIDLSRSAWAFPLWPSRFPPRKRGEYDPLWPEAMGEYPPPGKESSKETGPSAQPKRDSDPK